MKHLLRSKFLFTTTTTHSLYISQQKLIHKYFKVLAQYIPKLILKILTLTMRAIMSLRDTMNQMNRLLADLAKDLGKAGNGNKSAAQRVRTGTIRLQRVAKLFRKESVAAENSGQLKRKSKSRKKNVKKSRKSR
jgi:hypothetical protein